MSHDFLKWCLMKSRLNHWGPSATSFIISLHRHLQQNQFLLALQLSPMKWPIHFLAVFLWQLKIHCKPKLSNLTYSNQNPPPRMPSWQIKDWTNPFEKYIQVKLDHLPKFWGEHQNIFETTIYSNILNLKMEVWFKWFFPFQGDENSGFHVRFFFCLGGCATVSFFLFRHFFWEGIIPHHFLLSKPFAGHVKSNRLRSSITISAFIGVKRIFALKRSRGPTGPSWGLHSFFNSHHS